MIKRVVITGGPGSGKTALIESLKSEGYSCFDEVSRAIIQQENIQTSFKDFDFESAVFKQRLEDFKTAQDGLSFYDRSLVDGLAYMQLNQVKIPEHFQQMIQEHKYHTEVFIAPPWESIYQKDEERLEDYSEAICIYQELRKVYQANGYHLLELPKVSIEERLAFVCSHF